MSSENEGKTCSFNVCSQCKSVCCIDAKPPLTQNHMNQITEYLQQHEMPVDNVFVLEAYAHPTVVADGYCVFFSKETGNCRVHPVKPETCVAGPVTFDINLRTRKLEFYLKKGAICALAECLPSDQKRFQSHLEIAKQQILRLVEELDSAALTAILKIEEPQTLKICENDLPNDIFQKLKPAL